MLKLLETHRPAIQKELERFLDRETLDINSWSRDVRKRVLEYTLRGKMIRGALVFTGAGLASPSMSGTDQAAIGGAAAAMELIQSFLLIHDDIMDDDDIRRGKAAVHTQYRHHAAENNWGQPERTGIALGICAGDIAGFWAMQLLGEIPLSTAVFSRVMKLVSKEIVTVGMAQMLDVSHGVQDTEPGFEDIISVYRYKTGRYTFALPLMLGWIIAGGDEKQLDLLGALGEAMGVIFQIQDDYIGIFGDSSVTGKPNTSDIAENKKTLYRLYLHEMLRQQDNQDNDTEVLKAFGSEEVSELDMERIREAMHRYGVLDRVSEVKSSYEEKCSRIIDELCEKRPDAGTSLRAMLKYIGTRNS